MNYEFDAYTGAYDGGIKELGIEHVVAHLSRIFRHTLLYDPVYFLHLVTRALLVGLPNRVAQPVPIWFGTSPASRCWDRLNLRVFVGQPDGHGCLHFDPVAVHVNGFQDPF